MALELLSVTVFFNYSSYTSLNFRSAKFLGNNLLDIRNKIKQLKWTLLKNEIYHRICSYEVNTRIPSNFTNTAV